jgi:hypothetical protein
MPTVKELHNKIRQHNASNCIKGYSSKKKATLVKIVSNLNTPTQQKQAGAGAGANKKKITPTLVSAVTAKKKKKITPTFVSAVTAKKKKKITPTLVSAVAGKKKKKKITPTLVSAVAGKKKKKKITPTLVSAGVGGGSSMSFGMPAGGGTEAQKKFEKKLLKQKEAYKKLDGKDANPELAF